MKIVLATLVVFSLSVWQSAECAKILAIFPFGGPSQYIVIQPFLKELAARGHEVSVISAFPQKKKIQNFRDIPSMKVLESYEDAISNFMETSQDPGLWEELNLFNQYLTSFVKFTFEEPNVQQLLNSNETFDIVLVEAMQVEALFGFAQHFNAHLVGFSSFGTDANIDEYVGNVSPLAYSPGVTSDLTENMDFLQRLRNLWRFMVAKVFAHCVQLPQQEAIYKHYFPHATASLYDVRKNFSLMLLNQHFSIGYARPYVPSMIEVSGFHINYKPAPLPADIEAFINASTNGVIYFSLGSNVKSKYLPREILEVFMKVFASLKENILWKFEDPELPGKPDNVFISKWFPQPDILAHPKVKLFISHGGLLSTTEAIYHGKPVLGIPFFYDQFVNVRRAVDGGFALSQNIRNLKEDELSAAIKEMLSNGCYAETATKLSQRFHDRPVKPMDAAVFWTEYLLRHGGAPHMRVKALDYNFIQNNSLDTAGLLVAGFALAVFVIVFAICKLVKLITGKGNVAKTKVKRN